jgi:hypothetical protein
MGVGAVVVSCASVCKIQAAVGTTLFVAANVATGLGHARQKRFLQLAQEQTDIKRIVRVVFQQHAITYGFGIKPLATGRNPLGPMLL